MNFVLSSILNTVSIVGMEWKGMLSIVTFNAIKGLIVTDQWLTVKCKCKEK